MSRSLFLVVLISLFVSIHAAAPGATCWYPDGVTTVPGHSPCNQTGSAPAACCDPLDSCSTSGYCLGRSGWPYRGSCTDQTWGSPNCARQEQACVSNPVTNQPYNFFVALWTCGNPGVEAKQYCCGFDTNSCCKYNFTLGSTGASFKPGYDALIANITSGKATTDPTITNTTATNSADSKSTGNSDLGTKIGLGVGIPLGVLVLGALALGFWRVKKMKAYKGIDTPMSSVNNGATGGNTEPYMDNNYQNNTISPGNTYQSPQPSPAQIYAAPQQKPDQWNSAPRYEAPMETAPQELASSAHR